MKITKLEYEGSEMKTLSIRMKMDMQMVIRMLTAVEDILEIDITTIITTMIGMATILGTMILGTMDTTVRIMDLHGAGIEAGTEAGLLVIILGMDGT